MSETMCNDLMHDQMLYSFKEHLARAHAFDQIAAIADDLVRKELDVAVDLSKEIDSMTFEEAS